ncbi:hypothetical protein Pla123a_08820 [Posidoniimonas polymericola]|uniref:Uncharacterized protein n=1 Tax=Posidoniimonas polymericola TaxID=2528002 RepID=A0A5C5YTT6_9BACT|nr:hypothetical protein [Posidoniimonas polymericola]TWT78093.1 hypothetical protein Pla123a_08820 [Posidoniimonas polymericola]
MVNNLAWTLAQAKEKATPLEQLDPQSRLVVVISLLALVLTGLGLIALTMIGGRWVRRVVRERRPPRAWPDHRFAAGDAPDDPDAPVADPYNASETLHDRRSSSDTES